MSDAQRIGSSFNHYRIVSKLGSGGMGEVYLAEDTKLERRVALKILLAEVANDETRVRRFVQEAKAASALNHPNILTVHEIGNFEGSQYIVTEYIKGETLRDRLSAGQLSLRETLDVTMQVAAALSAAHNAGIVHRDIKPENIMLRDDGIAKVLDFGLVKLTEKKKKLADSKDATRVKTDPGMVMGTANYMSPEQARGKETDARTDVWSLGVVLYEMLAGETPFAGETANDSIAAILTKEPPTLAPELPYELHRFIRRALQKKPDERYQTIKDFLHDVQDLKRELEVSEEIERSHIPSMSRSTNVGITQSGENVTAMHPTAISTQNSMARQPSSAEYIVSELKQHKRGALGLLIVLMIGCVVAGSYFFWFASSASGAITSIAVLPFENGSGDPDLDYLSDGLSESLIDKLSGLPQLKVIARNSSFKYRGTGLDLQEIANKLGVRAIVTGKVARVGDSLNVRVEMVDATENRQLWSEQYNRKATDLLTVQREISQTASDKLRLKLSGSQEQQLSKPGTADPQAYELVLKGRFYDNKGGTENRKRANEYFQQAVSVDPNYALAYAELADSYSGIAASSEVDQKEYLSKAEVAARKALELDENLPDAHISLGFLNLHAWKWAAAEQEYERAIELNPNLPHAHGSYAAFLSRMCRHDEAIAEAMRARELDPLSLSANRILGYRLYHARRYDEAIEVFKKIIEMDPNYDSAYVLMAYAYTAKGQFKEAINAYQEAIRLGDKSTSVQVYLGEAYVGNGEREKAQTILKQLQTTKEYVSPGELAVLYGALGDKDAAFASLEKAYNEHDLQLQFLKVDPSYDRLRDDPRFADLIRRVGLPQ
jgi:serine/threonine-protein kinase